MQHVILFTPSRCCKGRMGEAVAATRQLQYVRQRGGVRARLRILAPFGLIAPSQGLKNLFCLLTKSESGYRDALAYRSGGYSPLEINATLTGRAGFRDSRAASVTSGRNQHAIVAPSVARRSFVGPGYALRTGGSWRFHHFENSELLGNYAGGGYGSSK